MGCVGSLTIVYPLDYARTRLASDVGSGNPQFTGLVDCLMKTAAGGGIMSMYNGFGVLVVGIVAYRGPYFGVYDTLKDLNPFKKDTGIVGLFSKFCIAQTTAIIAGFISYPFDTVRRRLQMQSEKPRDQWLYSGTLDCTMKIIKDEGAGACGLRRDQTDVGLGCSSCPCEVGLPLNHSDHLDLIFTQTCGSTRLFNYVCFSL